MGLFTFLFGGKKNRARPEAPKKPLVSDKSYSAPSAPVVYAHASATAGVAQAKLRLKLVASLRSGDSPAAYQAATGLADIQLRAGRKTVARTWQQQAERIKLEAGLSA